MRSTTTRTGEQAMVFTESDLKQVTLYAAAGLVVVALLSANSYLLVGAIAFVVITLAVKSHIDAEVHQDFTTPLETAWYAALHSLGENGSKCRYPTWLQPTQGRVDGGDASVVVEKHPGGVSRVRIRVGTFNFADNRRRAALLLEAIVKHLEEKPAA